MERVIIIGASPKPERYANKAQKMLIEYGHTPLPVNPAFGEIDGIMAYRSATDVPGPVDSVTMYVGPDRQDAVLDAIIAAQPRRVIFNPGTENPVAYERLAQAGIQTTEACTLVLLRTGQF